MDSVPPSRGTILSLAWSPVLRPSRSSSVWGKKIRAHAKWLREDYARLLAAALDCNITVMTSRFKV